MRVEATKDAMVQAFARAIEAQGGKALLVGGLVRDEILGLPSKDYDFEVFGLPMKKVQQILSQFGNVKEVGQQFGVLNIQELDWDVALPRREMKTGEGHKGFDVVPDPTMSIEDAARRRDLTINALSKDPLTGEIIDPLNGIADLEDGILRMADPNTFGDDPLRALRVAQFAARFDFDVDPATLAVVAAQPLEELPGERILPEFSKMLLKGKKPSRGIEVMRRANLLRYFPEIEALQGVPQDAIHHPEGDVYVHTLMVLDEAAKERTGDPAFDLPLMFGALCHDFGKPEFTQHVEDRIKSHGHEEGGEAPTREFLQRMKAPNELTEQVATLVSTHLRPQLMAGTGGRKGYRKLSRLLSDANVSPELLAAVSKADSLGRTTESALRRDTSRQDQFLQEYNEHVTSQAPAGGKLVDSVSGKHLIAKGFKPGPDMGKFLALTRSIEDETGISNPDKLIELATRFLSDRSEGSGSQKKENPNDCGDSHIRPGEECFDGDYREERKKGNTKSTLADGLDWTVSRPCGDDESYPDKCTGPGSEQQWELPPDPPPYQKGDELALPPELEEKSPVQPKLGPDAWDLPFTDEELNNPKQKAADEKMLKKVEKEQQKKDQSADRAGQDLEKAGDKAIRDAKKLQEQDAAKKDKELEQRRKISDRDALKKEKEWQKNRKLQEKDTAQQAKKADMAKKAAEKEAQKEALKQQKLDEKAKNDAAKQAAKLTKEQEQGLKKAEQDYNKWLATTPKTQVPQGMDFQAWLKYVLLGPEENSKSGRQINKLHQPNKGTQPSLSALAGKGPSGFRTNPDPTEDDFLLWHTFEWPADQKGKSQHPGLAGLALGDPRPCYPEETPEEGHCNPNISPQTPGSGNELSEHDLTLIRDQARLQHAETPEQIQGLTDAWKAAKSVVHTNPEILSDPEATENLALQLVTTMEPRNQGRYRHVPVTFGPGKPPGLDPDRVPRAMESLFMAYSEQLLEPDEWYHEFQKVHPFEDGNGRVDDLLWKMDKVRRGEPWPNTHPPDFFGTDKSDYTAEVTAEPQRLHKRTTNYPGVKDFDRGTRFSKHPLEGPFGRDGFGGSTPLPQKELESGPNGMTPETGIFPDWTGSGMHGHGQPDKAPTRPHEHMNPETSPTDPNDYEKGIDYLDWDESPTHSDVGPDNREPFPGADEFPKSEPPNDKGAGFLATQLPFPQLLDTDTPHPSPARSAEESPPSSFPGQVVRKPGGGGLDRAPMRRPVGKPSGTGFLPVQNTPAPDQNMFKADLDPSKVPGPGGQNPGGKHLDRQRGGRGGGTKIRPHFDYDYTGKKPGFQSIDLPTEHVYPADVEAARTMEDLMDIDSVFPKDYNPEWGPTKPEMGGTPRHRNERHVAPDPIKEPFVPEELIADDDANIEQKQVQPLVPNQKMAIAVDPNGPMGERIVIMSPLFEEASPAIMALRSHRFERHGGVVIDGPPQWLLGITPRLEALDRSSGHEGADDLFARVMQLIQSAGMPIEYEQEPRP
jgi:tRNA nucleotidyltransferase (CCA-adding enzyme)